MAINIVVTQPTITINVTVPAPVAVDVEQAPAEIDVAKGVVTIISP